MQATNTGPRFDVVADGQGICSHLGAALLGELADRLGLTVELGRRANTGVRAGAYDRSQVLRDLVVMLADGGDWVSDLASLGDQAELFGEVCSTPTAWRVLAEELPGDPRGIAGLWSALARVRERAWALGAAPQGPLLLDLDATLVQAHSDNQGAAPTDKQGFGFHPLGPGWTAAMAPARPWPSSCGPATPGPTPPPIIWRCWRWPCLACQAGPSAADPGAGATLPAPPTPSSRSWSTATSSSRLGSTATSASNKRSSACPSRVAPRPGPRRPTPPGRLGRRAHRPGPCQGGLADRHQGDLPPRAAPPRRGTQAGLHRRSGAPLPGLCHQPARPRPCPAGGPPPPHAHVEDPIRTAKATGLGNLPFADFGANDAWRTLVMIAQTLVCWAQALLLSGDLNVAEPKTLGYRLWHTAGRIVHHARRVIVPIDRAWP